MIVRGNYGLQRLVFAVGMTVGSLVVMTGRTASSAGEAQRFLVERWSVQQGLPQNTVRCLIQTRDGYLWAGTRAGLGRFDGKRFTVFKQSNTPEMPDENCVSLAEDSNGGLWIGTERGLLRRKGYRFEAVSLAQRSDQPAIRSLCPSSSGGVWVGTDRGLHLLDSDGKPRLVSTNGLFGNNIRCVFEDSLHRTWAGVDISQSSGILQMKAADNDQFVSIPETSPSLQEMTHAITEQSGAIWWGNNSGLHTFDPLGIHYLNVRDHLLGNLVKSLQPIRDGGLIVVTGESGEIPGRRGLQLFRSSSSDVIDLKMLGVEDDVLCAIDDREGNIWIGTRRDGLIQLKKRSIRAVTKIDGLLDDHVTSVTTGKDGNVFIASQHGLSTFHADSITKLPHLQDQRDQIRSIFQTRFETLYIARTGPDITLLKNGRWDGNPSSRIRMSGELHALCDDDEGNLWICHDKGVTRMKIGTEYTAAIEQSSFLTNIEVRTAFQDRSGAMWFGSKNSGAFRMRNSDISLFDTSNGLSDSRTLSFYEDDENAIWIGTENGLNCIRQNHVDNIFTKDGLFDRQINCILDDNSGNLWMSCSRGIFKVGLKNLRDVLAQRTNLVHCVSYGESSGMPSSETVSGTQPVGCKDNDGKLWFATVKGAAVIDPLQIVENTTPPIVVIEKVLAKGETLFGEGCSLPPKIQNHSSARFPQLHIPANKRDLLEIHYTANTFVDTEKSRFKYILEGRDQNWSFADSSERRIVCVGLKPGSYTFRLTACNNHGYWSASEAKLQIEIEPFFFETRVFYSSAFLALLGIGFANQQYRARSRRRIFEFRQREALANERARIASDLHDDLGASLTGIGLQIDAVAGRMNDRPNAETQLKQAAEAVRLLVDQMREVIWALNPRCDSLESFVNHLTSFAEQFLGAASIRLRLDLPEKVPALPFRSEVRHQFFLAAKEAMNNTVKHAGATEVTLSIRCDANLITVIIKDNGRGIPVNGRQNDGNGIANIRRRVKTFGGDFKLESDPDYGTSIVISAVMS